MGFTDLIARSFLGKAISQSHCDGESVVATTKKIYKALNPLDNEKLLCNSIGAKSEKSNYTKLCNHVIITALKFNNSSNPICNQNHHRTEFFNSKCIRSDFSNLDTTKKFFYQIQLFFTFCFLIVA